MLQFGMDMLQQQLFGSILLAGVVLVIALLVTVVILLWTIFVAFFVFRICAGRMNAVAHEATKINNLLISRGVRALGEKGQSNAEAKKRKRIRQRAFQEGMDYGKTVSDSTNGVEWPEMVRK